ncbi:MAG: mreD [Rhabdochlamydiaceae bacterium]
MRQVPLIFPFSLALIFAICGTVFLPHLRLFAFAPFLALLYNKTTFTKSLWLASICGLAIDLLCSEFRLGIHALNYCLTTLLLYKQKRHFVEDKQLALCLFTAIISGVSTLLQFFLIALFDHALPLSGKMFITELTIMPLADAVYAFLWFTCPMMLYAHIKKIGWRAYYSKLLNYFRFLYKKEKL